MKATGVLIDRELLLASLGGDEQLFNEGLPESPVV